MFALLPKFWPSIVSVLWVESTVVLKTTGTLVACAIPVVANASTIAAKSLLRRANDLTTPLLIN
jgi:hypothetical protein